MTDPGVPADAVPPTSGLGAPGEAVPPADRSEQPGDTPEEGELRSQLISAAVEVERLRRKLARMADEHAAAIAENHRLRRVLARSRAERIAARLQRARRVEGDRSPATQTRGIPLASMRCDLSADGAGGAVWLADALVAGGRAPALQQPVGTTIRYRLRADGGWTMRLRALLPPMVWREAGAAATATVRLRDASGAIVAERTVELLASADGGLWEATQLELPAPASGAAVLELEATARPTQWPVPYVWWVTPELVPGPDAGPSSPAMASPDGQPSGPLHSGAPGDGPRFSILTPVHDPEPRVLREMLASVRRQSCDDWELCLVDDGGGDETVRAALDEAAAADRRIRVAHREHGGGISAATNDALAMATGAFVVMLDHDDVLADHALDRLAAALDREPDLDLLYSDEDHLTEHGQRFERYCKPDWSPDSLRSQMYVGHVCAARRALVVQAGGWRSDLDGSQDYDLVLRLTERTDRIAHVGVVLYHWRVSSRSAASGEGAKPYAYDAARRALQEHLGRIGAPGEVTFGPVPGTYRVAFEPPPQATVQVALTVDGPPQDRQAQALGEALAAGGHDHLSIGLRGPSDAVHAWSQALPVGTVSPAPEGETADYLLLLDGPPASASEGWLRTMLGFVALDGVAAVGAKVLSAQGLIEHAGIVVGDGLPLPVYHGAEAGETGHLSTLVTTVNRSAVSGAVLLPYAVHHDLDPALGPLAVIDYCLRARERGLRVIWTAQARLTVPTAAVNDVGALAAFRARWQGRMAVDPLYSAAAWQQRGDYQLLDEPAE